MAEKQPVDIRKLFLIEPESVTISGLNAMIKFSNFHPLNTHSMREGIELGDDLRSDKGTVLYPTGTELSWERINRLLKFREANPDMNFDFRIKSSDNLLDNLRKNIKDKLKNLFNSRQKAVVFKKLMRNLSPKFDEVVDKVLADDKLTLELFRLRFLAEHAENQRALFFVDHALNTGIFAAAIASSQKYQEILKDQDNVLPRFLTAGMFHNYGAVADSDRIIQAKPEERQKLYWSAVSAGLDQLSDMEVGEDMIQAYRMLSGWQRGDREFVKQNDGAALANVLVVAEHFLRKEDGLFGDSAATKDVVDKMNVLAMQHQFNDTAVNALTLGLELTDIFDFYAELDRLIKKCPYDSAVPYPLTGLYSPTIFVCKKNVTKCPFLEMSVRAVNLMQRQGELPAGEYHRCKLLTPKLNSFYDDHYEEIKEAVGGDKAAEKAGKKPAKEGPGEKVSEGQPAPARQKGDGQDQAGQQGEEKQQPAEKKADEDSGGESDKG